MGRFRGHDLPPTHPLLLQEADVALLHARERSGPGVLTRGLGFGVLFSDAQPWGKRSILFGLVEFKGEAFREKKGKEGRHWATGVCFAVNNQKMVRNQRSLKALDLDSLEDEGRSGIPTLQERVLKSVGPSKWLVSFTVVPKRGPYFGHKHKQANKQGKQVTQTNTQTHKHTNTQAHKPKSANKQTDKQTADRQAGRQAGRQPDTQTGWQTGKQTGKQPAIQSN